MLGFLNRLSIRATLGLGIAALGVVLITTSALTLADAIVQMRRADRVALFSSASRDLLGTLLASRLERGVLLNALGAEAPINGADERDVAGYRATSEQGYAAVSATLQQVDVAGLSAVADRLRAAHDRMVALRPRVDAAVRQAKAARDAALMKEWQTAPSAYLDALTATTDLLDASVKLADPVADHLIGVKRAAWMTRLNAGGMALRIQTAIASGAAWTPADAQATAALAGRAAQAWTLVAEAVARPDAPASVVAAAEKAKINFEGALVDQRAQILAALAEGRTPEVEIGALRQQDTSSQGFIVDTAQAALVELVAHSDRQAAAASRHAVLASLLLLWALGLTLGGFIIAHTRVSRPIRAMTDAMRRLADRDMTVAIPGIGRGDEIGGMASAVTVFRDSMITADRLAAEQSAERAAKERRAVQLEELVRAFDAKATTIVETVASAATEMQGTANAMATMAGQATAQATAVAAASEQATVNVQTVAAATEELSASIAEIGRQVTASTEISSQAVGQAEQTNTTMRSLVEAADQIGQVMAIIHSIAGQTNLLALNATIEAARAGEAGKGFAVVASEVKNLASQTAKATEEIQTKVKEIQSATGGARAAIEGIGMTIGQISEVATTIAAAVEQQGVATRDIAGNVAQAARGTGEVSSTIVGVNHAVCETGTASAQVLEASGRLAGEAERLRLEVATFIAAVRAA